MWKEQDNELRATFKFKNFTQAFAFMTEVAFVAEAQHILKLFKSVVKIISP